jgi:hypothetical protein
VGDAGGGATVALLLAAAAMLVLRGAGMLLAGAMRPDHPFIRWATAVSQALLAAFVALAVIAPAGTLAGLPLAARLAGLAAGLVAYAVSGGRMLPSLGAGLAALLLVRAAVL